MPSYILKINIGDLHHLYDGLEKLFYDFPHFKYAKVLEPQDLNKATQLYDNGHKRRGWKERKRK